MSMRSPSRMAAAHSTPGLSVRHWPLAAAILLLVALWGGPLPAMARVSFTSHMVLHLSVMVLAAPLLALGAARLARRPERTAGLGLAVGGAIAEFAVVWGWHLPAFHEAAALVPAAFAAQQASFLGAGLLVWLPGLAGTGHRAAAAGTVAMLVSFMHMSMLGVLLATAPRAIYPPGVCGGFGLSPIDDQRLGGALMAVVGALPYLAGGLVFAARFLRTGGPERARDSGAVPEERRG
jgi:putative membrane protein